ncbi:unnamed protein product [Boreogadus saida]
MAVHTGTNMSAGGTIGVVKGWDAGAQLRGLCLSPPRPTGQARNDWEMCARVCVCVCMHVSTSAVCVCRRSLRSLQLNMKCVFS